MVKDSEKAEKLRSLYMRVALIALAEFVYEYMCMSVCVCVRAPLCFMIATRPQNNGCYASVIFRYSALLTQ